MVEQLRGSFDSRSDCGKGSAGDKSWIPANPYPSGVRLSGAGEDVGKMKPAAIENPSYSSNSWMILAGVL